MITLFFYLLLFQAGIYPGAGSAPKACISAAAAPELDHVVVVVNDLGEAAGPFAELGFRFKSGRLHANNLLNRHIKFRDGTELELMTVAGLPGDSMAQRYADLLAQGEGGAYVALEVADVTPVIAALRGAGLPFRHSTSGSWQFLSIALPSDAVAVFFGSGWVPPADPDSIFAHTNPAVTLAEAWLEGGPDLTHVLKSVGAAPCDTVALPDGRRGRRWALSKGSVVVADARPAARPRVIGVVFGTAAGRGGPEPIEVLPGFWLSYR